MVKIVGILNATPDSFYDGGNFDNLQKATIHLDQMLSAGADIIDVGAESTRPGAQVLTDDQEWQRLKDILPLIVKQIDSFNRHNKASVQISLDSYHLKNIKKAWDLGVQIINDVSGLVNPDLIKFIAQNNIVTILMHNLAIHSNPELIVNPYLNINQEIISWASDKIQKLAEFGVKKEQLIFDPGIGFAKNADQSIIILKNITDYRILGLPIYVGHSNKSFLDKVGIKDRNREQKTLIISKYLVKKGVDYLRVHDVAAHNATNLSFK